MNTTVYRKTLARQARRGIVPLLRQLLDFFSVDSWLSWRSRDSDMKSALSMIDQNA